MCMLAGLNQGADLREQTEVVNYLCLEAVFIPTLAQSSLKPAHRHRGGHTKGIIMGYAKHVGRVGALASHSGSGRL